MEQAPHQTYKKFHSLMLDHGFKMLNAYFCVYIKREENGNLIVLSLYINGTVIVGK